MPRTHIPRATQAEFALLTAATTADEHVAVLTRYLQRNPDWFSARQLAATFSIPDRAIRRLAELSQGEILSGPGSPGYKHISHATPAEISRVCDALRSQARHMISRHIRVRKAAHRIIR